MLVGLAVAEVVRVIGTTAAVELGKSAVVVGLVVVVMAKSVAILMVETTCSSDGSNSDDRSTALHRYCS